MVEPSCGVFVFVENQGAGVYAIRATFTLAPDWRDFEVTDADRDGRPDLVGIAAAADSSFWFENVGAFSFNFHTLPNSAEPQARSLARADLNGDGVDDFLVTRMAGDVDLVLSDVSLGAVPYAAASIRVDTVLPEFDGVVAADLDGDGDEDIVATASTGGVFGFENVGFSLPGEAQQLVAPVPGVFLGARDLLAVDLDGDSNVDILCVSTQRQWVRLEGDGMGGGSSRAFSTREGPR